MSLDQDFAEVMCRCAKPRPGKTPLTWITPRIMEAYWDLHEAGYAHSVEVWDTDGALVDGYGLAMMQRRHGAAAAGGILSGPANPLVG